MTPMDARNGNHHVPFRIVKGDFGRVLLGSHSRALVSHAHSQFNVMIKLGGEDARFQSANGEIRLGDAAAVLFNPWVPHAKLPNERYHTLNLVLEIEQDWMARLLDVDVPRLLKLFPDSCGVISPEIRAKSDQVAAALLDSLSVSTDECNELISGLIIRLVDEHGNLQSSGYNLSATRPTDFRIRRALHHLQTQITQNPNLEKVAAEVGLSRSHFFHQFKKCVGVSPQHYLDQQRMTFAVGKLLSSDITIASISDQLGFSSPAHFTRFFVQHIGVPPSEYRRVGIDVTTH